MPKAKAPKPIVIEFTVAYVVFGGNAGGGQYFYSFSPDVVMAYKDQKPVQMIYKLDEGVSKHFVIESLLSSDAKDQIYDIKIATDGRSVSLMNRNDQPTLIFFSVLVRDMKRKAMVPCDPQVGNDPEITPQANKTKKTSKKAK
ncbi:hypothetical protein K4L06_13540 [Lysobacter sp. BMK333-48F3]|uniref:hypothetical protein n=1 Tax=Lysobacter sp. BMK333-48F3 TaxID=2867962 RepID=UPI001C8BAB79|nr:hypothetical protein [Lysobacter sp. BMK333-48F3]MBX9402332.1 hypothetical protein [Lysobacter sp. BMK333-48F3]